MQAPSKARPGPATQLTSRDSDRQIRLSESRLLPTANIEWPKWTAPPSPSPACSITLAAGYPKEGEGCREPAVSLGTKLGTDRHRVGSG